MTDYLTQLLDTRRPVPSDLDYPADDPAAKGHRGEVPHVEVQYTDADYARMAAEDERKTRMMCEAMGVDYGRCMELRGEARS